MSASDPLRTLGAKLAFLIIVLIQRGEMAIREVDLDHAFADALEAEAQFRQWLLLGGRFEHLADDAVLLIDAQRTARSSARHRWKHWWCRLGDASESETDIFLVFEACGRRFSLHVENKPSHGTLGLRQAADYRRRAVFMANKDRYLNYSDFETIILAPEEFLKRHPDCVAQFDRSLTYEQVARFAPLFAAALEKTDQMEAPAERSA